MRASQVDITTLLQPDMVCAELEGSSRRAVLQELVHIACKSHHNLDEAQIIKLLLEREELAPSGLESGIAVPHAKIEQLENPILVIGKSLHGIDFNSIDGVPSCFFFLILVPESATSAHIALLAKIARLGKNERLLNKLETLKTNEELYQALIEADKRISC